MNREKLLTYLNNTENGLRQEKTVNGTTVALTYRPASLMAWTELNNTDTLTNKKIQEAISNYNKHMYFILSVSYQNKEILSYGGNRQKFSQMVNRLAFGMGDYVLLTSAQKDTIPLADYHYPRMYGMAPSTDILLAFSPNESLEAEYLQFKLSDLDLGTGDLKFKINTRDIKKANRITLNYKK